MPYFDYNATTPLAAVAREAWLTAQDTEWANPASPHRAGSRAAVRLETRRETVAAHLGGDPARVVWVSGATEAAHAVLAFLARTSPPGSRLALNPTEHPCVLGAAREAWGEARIVWLPVDADGVVSPAALAGVLGDGGPPVAAVAVMAANNETGVLQPWSELARAAESAGAAWVCDVSQWLGKLPAAGLGRRGWTFGSAHKFGGPKGIGLLHVPATGAGGFAIHPGGGQQRGLRGGTEDWPAVASMVAALHEAETTQVLWETERLRWRDAFVRAITARLPGTRVVGQGAERLWNTVALLMPHGEATRWVTRLDRFGFQVSPGAACSTGKGVPSHVLAALGVGSVEAARVVRVSAGWQTPEADWQGLVEAFLSVACEVRPDPAVVQA